MLVERRAWAVSATALLAGTTDVWAVGRADHADASADRRPLERRRLDPAPTARFGGQLSGVDGSKTTDVWASVPATRTSAAARPRPVP